MAVKIETSKDEEYRSRWILIWEGREVEGMHYVDEMIAKIRELADGREYGSGWTGIYEPKDEDEMMSVYCAFLKDGEHGNVSYCLDKQGKVINLGEKQMVKHEDGLFVVR